MADHITLDRDTFKALASDTRLDILKKLDERQKTVTELSRDLDLNKATVFEHLEKLVDVELVQKLEDERKWVYYQLTWKGKRLLHPEKITIALMLSSAVASVVTAFVAFWLWSMSKLPPLPGGGGFETLKAPAQDDARASDAGAASPALSMPADSPPPQDAAASGDPILMWVGIALLVACAIALASAWWTWRKAKARAAAPPQAPAQP